jgi:hypothetical protein
MSFLVAVRSCPLMVMNIMPERGALSFGGVLTISCTKTPKATEPKSLYPFPKAKAILFNLQMGTSVLIYSCN